MDHAIRLSDCSKSVGNQKNDGVIICWHDVVVKLFYNVIIFLFTSSDGQNFIIMTGSGVMTIFIYNGFDLKSVPCEFFLISADWGKLGILNLA